jgi:hypothetical protein
VKQVRPPKAQAVATPLNAQAKGLTKRFFEGVTSLERGAGTSIHGIHRRSNPQNKRLFACAFPANLSGKADSEGKRHSVCCGFSLPLEFL